MFAGLGRPGAFAGWLTNQEDAAGKWLPEINDAFDVSWLVRNNEPLRRLAFMIHGADKAITPEEHCHSEDPKTTLQSQRKETK